MFIFCRKLFRSNKLRTAGVSVELVNMPIFALSL